MDMRFAQQRHHFLGRRFRSHMTAHRHPRPEFPLGISLLSDSEQREIKVGIQEIHFSKKGMLDGF